MNRISAYQQLFFILAFLAVISLRGQTKLTGYIADATSGETIVGAYVTNHQNTMTSMYRY